MMENYMATYLIDVVALVFLCCLIHSNNILNRNRKWPFYFSSMLIVLIIVAEGGTIIAGDGNADLRFLNVFCNVFGFALTPVIPIVLVSILDVKILQTYKLLMLPSILNMFVTALSPWPGFIFYVDANNHYERGNLFYIFIIAYIINLFILLISTIKTGYSEMKKGNVQRVRGDFLSPIFKPRITFAIDSVTFNMSCVNLFPDNQYVVINVDEANQRIIIEACMDYDRDSLKFANLKGERNNPRKCMARIFCSMVYEMMGWNRAAKYRSMAIFQELGDKKIIVFNLDECLQVFTEVVESGDGKQKRSTVINMPEDWKGRFGYSLEEIDAKYRVDTASTFVTVDNVTGERHDSRIEAKLPTPEELIHRPYGGIRSRQEVDE